MIFYYRKKLHNFLNTHFLFLDNKTIIDENLTKLQVKLVAKIIDVFNKDYLKEINMSPLFEVPLFI